MLLPCTSEKLLKFVRKKLACADFTTDQSLVTENDNNQY